VSHSTHTTEAWLPAPARVRPGLQVHVQARPGSGAKSKPQKEVVSHRGDVRIDSSWGLKADPMECGILRRVDVLTKDCKEQTR